MKISLCLRSLLLCASIATSVTSEVTGQSKPAAPARTNVMSMASGAVLLSTSGEYGSNWIALNLLAGTPGRGWSSPEGKPFPQTFVNRAVPALPAEFDCAGHHRHAGRRLSGHLGA